MRHHAASNKRRLACLKDATGAVRTITVLIDRILKVYFKVKLVSQEAD